MTGSSQCSLTFLVSREEKYSNQKAREDITTGIFVWSKDTLSFAFTDTKKPKQNKPPPPHPPKKNNPKKRDNG